MSSFDEAAHAGREHFDPEYVAGYDAKSGVGEQEELELLESAGLSTETIMVDFGAGTGRTALLAASIARQVVAVDVSPAMLAPLRTEVAKRKLANVRVVEAGFLTYEHKGAPPSLVHSRNALHHLPDSEKALALSRIARLLDSGGSFILRDLVWSFPRDRADEVLARWFAAAADDPATGWTRVELEEHVQTEHSPWSDDLERMLEAAGFAIVERDYRSPTFADYVCELR
jgi:SAM-dependent methyltransferase